MARMWGGPERRPWTPKDTMVLAAGLALGALAGIFIGKLVAL